MATKSTKATVPGTAKVDEIIDVGQQPFIVRLPDGTVVSGTTTYTPKHAGEHVFTIDGTEHTVEVSDK